MTENNGDMNKVDFESIFYWLARHDEIMKQKEYTEKQIALLTNEIEMKVDIIINNGNYEDKYTAKKEFLYALTDRLTRKYYVT